MAEKSHADRDAPPLGPLPVPALATMAAVLLFATIAVATCVWVKKLDPAAYVVAGMTAMGAIDAFQSLLSIEGRMPKRRHASLEKKRITGRSFARPQPADSD